MKAALLALVLAAAPAFALNQGAPVPRRVIHDHDGDVDDLNALGMLLRSPGVRVKLVTICPADSYKEPAVRATRGLLHVLGVEDVDVAASDDAGTHPFPDEWRRDTMRLADLPALATPGGRLGSKPAGAALAEFLSKESGVEVLETGPLTNVAAALALSPALARRIRRITVMGGAVRVPGNVRQPGHDGSAEWNFYNNPAAAAKVIASGIPITLVGLDATNKTPVTRSFLRRLEERSSSRPVARTFLEMLRLVDSYIENPDPLERYFFWDTLAAAALLDPGVVKVVPMRIRVVTEGPSAGRVVEAKDGAPVDVAVDADREKVEALILSLLAS